MRLPNRLTVLALLALLSVTAAAAEHEVDAFATSKGELKITFLGHGTLMIQFDGKVVHIDPVSRYADYAKLPKADLILVTHEHGDHLDQKAIDLISKPGTELILTQLCAKKLGRGRVMKNGDTETVDQIAIAAVPAYNIVHVRSPGQPFHPRGAGNGYVLTLGDRRVYVAGDTENVPEMKELKDINIAFLPMNLPYTMTPEMVAQAARTLRPKILYPYHYGNTDTSKLLELLKSEKDIEVRIRKLQ